MPTELAVGGGALGFLKAMDEVFPATRHRRCWFHKAANVLNHFPKSVQPAVTADLHEISHAETRAAALRIPGRSGRGFRFDPVALSNLIRSPIPGHPVTL